MDDISSDESLFGNSDDDGAAPSTGVKVNGVSVEAKPSAATVQRTHTITYNPSAAAIQAAIGQKLARDDLVFGPFAPLKGDNPSGYEANPKQTGLKCHNCANYCTSYKMTSKANRVDVWSCDAAGKCRGVPNRCETCPVCSKDKEHMQSLRHSCLVQ
eukprot:CAMPEP_0182547046 /NCGR_PEP_ID=MMETSP1323-20130603/36923_1 /TAXON_ID=236787 /ORGANISM="Florenciella parvula, Strain RCC1693" /LENGTH=156 /DNA_ID=CAMNT_0024758317 /DNA_START=178 /DNA_END=645 /DNA_ORIENTATION=-